MQTQLTMGSRRYLVLATALVLQGCATTYDPDTLAAPTQVSCIYLDQPVTNTQTLGMFKIPWTTRLEQGPYWSEKVDANGTYFRAPPGGLSLKNDDGQPLPGHAVTRDGGFYVPHNAAAPITLYFYYSTADAPTQPDLLNADCSNLHVLKDPQTEKISVAAFAAGGAIGGAAGAVVGRSIASASPMSYGQAAGVGAAGGLIGGVIVAAIINSEVGNIHPFFPPPDAATSATLKALSVKQTLVTEAQVPTTASANPR